MQVIPQEFARLQVTREEFLCMKALMLLNTGNEQHDTNSLRFLHHSLKHLTRSYLGVWPPTYFSVQKSSSVAFWSAGANKGCSRRCWDKSESQLGHMTTTSPEHPEHRCCVIYMQKYIWTFHSTFDKRRKGSLLNVALKTNLPFHIVSLLSGKKKTLNKCFRNGKRRQKGKTKN